MTDSRGWKKRDNFRLAETGRRKRKIRKSKQKKAVMLTSVFYTTEDMK